MVLIINKGSRDRLVKMQRDLINQHAKFYNNGVGNEGKRKQILKDLSAVAKEFKGKVDDSAMGHGIRLVMDLKNRNK